MIKRITIIICIISAAMTGRAQTQNNHDLEVAKQLEIFGSLYRNLDLMYVDTLNPSQVIGKGIKAMLSSLDPYTEYYPESETKELKTMITGKYGGIGSVVSYDLQTGYTLINEPYLGMPAQEVGLKKGDAILAIDGEDMKGKGTSYVSDHLRGDAGTSFMLTYLRPGTKKPKTVKITRRAIQTPAVAYNGMLTDSIGFISLSQFTDECSRDVRRAILSLKQQGMQSMILDLRGNSGGSLSEAVNILNFILPKGITVVKTKGKMAKVNASYVTSQLPIDTIMPVVVLVNGNSASASEITCGVIQDLDRGVVIGTKTYGKGLVQLPLPLPYNAKMKVTTSHYYIPSGRCIQAIRYTRGANETVADSLRREFKTSHGRTVKDGGGIMPDIVITPDSLPNIVYYMTNAGLDSTNVMMKYVVDYVASHPTIAPARTFNLSDADYADYCQRVVDSGFKYDRESGRFLADLIKVAKFEGYYDKARKEFDALEQKLKHDLRAELDYHQKIIRQALASDIVSCYYYQEGAVENSLQHDKQVKEAISLLRNPKRYHDILNGVSEQKKNKK